MVGIGLDILLDSRVLCCDQLRRSLVSNKNLMPKRGKEKITHVGGESLELPACMIGFLFTADPTDMPQLFCDAASIAGDQLPAAMGWPFLE